MAACSRDPVLYPDRWVEALRAAPLQVKRALYDAGIDERLPSMESFEEFMADKVCSEFLLEDCMNLYVPELRDTLQDRVQLKEDINTELEKCLGQARMVRRRTGDLPEATVAGWARLSSPDPPLCYRPQ